VHTLLAVLIPRRGAFAPNRAIVAAFKKEHDMVATQITTELGDAIVESDVVFGSGGGRELRCDIYTPPATPTNAAGILLLHGGGWSQGARSMPGMVAFGTLLSQRGHVCVAVEYRLSGEAAWPAQLHDAKAALRWTRHNARRLGIDPDRIAVLGKSAGAHIALMMAATQDDPAHEGDGGTPGVGTAFAATVAFYPPTRLGYRGISESPAVKALMGANLNPEALAAASPLEYAGRRAFPPTLLIHGNGDTVVSPGDSLRMYEALAGAGVPVELHMYAGLPHAFDNGAPHYQRQCAEYIDLFLARYLPAGGHSD
jgi:acetyl esterase/lipase